MVAKLTENEPPHFLFYKKSLKDAELRSVIRDAKIPPDSPARPAATAPLPLAPSPPAISLPPAGTHRPQSPRDRHNPAASAASATTRRQWRSPAQFRPKPQNPCPAQRGYR